MYKKIIIQLLLLILLLGAIASFFYIYFEKKENFKEKNKTTIKNVGSEIDNETGTLIKDIVYSFSDQSGNYYELFSELGKIDIKDSEKMFMTNVKAIVYLKNSAPINIVSKYANYNKVSHETNFFENVEVTHLIHKATSENLDISFSNNTALMYNNIIYNKPGTQLTADRLEIDLITKNSKVFMDNQYERIKIIDKK
jgi:LPS export ABC transporter protein LptC